MTSLCHLRWARTRAIAYFLVSVAASAPAIAQEKPSPNMKYQVGWVAAMGNTATAEINKQAAAGWKLKSVSMAQCPTRDPAKTFSCVMIVMEKEDK